MTRIINFIGGPGAGKSTLAGELFGWMKRNQLNCEYVSEFAKDLTWQKSNSLDDQLYLLGNQHHRLYTLLGQVDWIITDSPLLLSIHYVETAFEKYRQYEHEFDDCKWALIALIQALWICQDNRIFFVDRGDRKYVEVGRVHTEDEAIKIDNQLKELLDKYHYVYYTVNSLEQVLKELLLIDDKSR